MPSFEISNFRFAILIDSYVTAPGGALATQRGLMVMVKFEFKTPLDTGNAGALAR
jgi:hypothetical protein